MEDLKVLLKSCINIIDEVFYLTLNENLPGIGQKYSELSNNINKFYLAMLNEGCDVSPVMIKQMEEIYKAFKIGDCIAILDISRFEMKPILLEYLKGIGDNCEKK